MHSFMYRTCICILIQLLAIPQPQLREDAADAAHTCRPQPATYQHSEHETTQAPRQPSAFPCYIAVPNHALDVLVSTSQTRAPKFLSM